MSLKIEQKQQSYLQVSSVQPFQKPLSSSIDSIHQMADSTTPQMSCWDSLIACLQSIFTMIVNLLTCKSCCQSKLEKLLEDPKAFLEILMSMDPTDTGTSIPEGQKNTIEIHNSSRRTILFYLCDYEGDARATERLGFEITSEIIQKVASKKEHIFNEDNQDWRILSLVKSAETADLFLKDSGYLGTIEYLYGKGLTPLHLAVIANRAAVVERFIARGANILAVDSPDEQTPIHKIRSVEMAEIFAKVGANFDAIDNKFNTLTSLLDEEKDKALIKYLADRLC